MNYRELLRRKLRRSEPVSSDVVDDDDDEMSPKAFARPAESGRFMVDSPLRRACVVAVERGAKARSRPRDHADIDGVELAISAKVSPAARRWSASLR
jgi:hypothetical protein